MGLLFPDLSGLDKQSLAQDDVLAIWDFSESELKKIDSDAFVRRTGDTMLGNLVVEGSISDNSGNTLSDKVDKNGTDRLMTADEGTKLSGIESNAQVNQAAFSHIAVGESSIDAINETSTVTLVAGSNVTLTPDPDDSALTISATDTIYTHPDSPVTPGTYTSVTVDQQGHVTAGSNPNGTAATKDYTDSVTNGSSDLVTSGAVYTAIENLPEPMIFKGSLGQGGTIQVLPTAASTNEGFTYKVITANIYAGQAAKVGDLFISDGTQWVYIPSADEPSGTVTSVNLTAGTGIDVSGGPVTTSGSITVDHKDTSSQASVSNSGRTYIQSVTLDGMGHVTGLESATETVVNTDRYVDSASFSDNSTADPTNPVKMTLIRAGSDSATVTADIPQVSSTSAGVAPKGQQVVTQSQTTKFLREDGTWQAPSYSSYTFEGGTNQFTVTPSGGSSQAVQVTPSIADNITGSGTSGYIVKFNGTNTITNGPAIGSDTTKYLRNDGEWAVPPDNDTKNTAGSTDTSSKIYLVGALSQADNPQTYSDDEVYVTNGVLTSKSVQIGGSAATLQYNSTTNSIDFIFS